jgi:nicotinate-nucleotide pyrophosphorylase (carboxylating)
LTLRKELNPLRNYFNVRNALLSFLREDIGTGDITSSSVIGETLLASSTILCKESSPVVIAGLEEVQLIFKICKCSTTLLVNDGSIVGNGKKIMRIKGRAKNILKAERTALNFLMRMTGIATETKRFVDAVKKVSKNIKISSTRKTAPGLRYFDKKAVKIGGGYAHRNSLEDMVLIKDNHLILTGSIRDSILNAKRYVGKNIKIECEVTSLDSAIEAIQNGADIVMLDNFLPTEVKRAIQNLDSLGLRQKCLIEVSGGVNLKNIMQFAKARPDIISIGSLTHSVKSADFSLDIDALH